MSNAARTDRTAVAQPEVVVFDVNETLSDMSPLAATFQRFGMEAREVEPWFAGVLRDGFALTSAGVNPAFADVASEALRTRLATHGVANPDIEDVIGEVIATFAALDVHPDVVDGVHALVERDVRLVTLSNGSRSVAEALLGGAGLSDDFERLLSVEDAPAWKPHPASYAHALSECGVTSSKAMLVAAHPWDIDGAARAGLRTGWLNRNGARYPSYFTAPDVEAPDLVKLAQGLR